MSNTVQNLDGWLFKASDDTAWQPARVPGCVHTDLLRNGRIPDPFYGTNERDLQWIDKKDWDYEVAFDASAELLKETHQELVFDGLDTYADVYVNGRHVLAADNMFRSWRVDVTGLLKPEANTLTVHFRSPIQEDLPKLERLGYSLPAPNDLSELGGLGENRISVFARKAPYHYGWDWGPRFVTSGIWREVRLEGWSGYRLTDLYIRQDEVTAEVARLTAVVEVEAEYAGPVLVHLMADDHSWGQPVIVQQGRNQLEIPLTIEAPALWWCRGLGEAKLYTFRAALLADGREVSAKSVRTGLRSVRLVREREAGGTSFYLELNGVPVFAKGANHIPNDSFVPEVTDERYRQEVATAVESGMNMLRVWGGGIYEEDIFYELCDESGLLVWQDFMFACSMYPGDEAFLLSVRAEAEDNLKRLRNHPSLALWCGNNEIDSAWAHFNENSGWGWKQQFTSEQREGIWHDYKEVFHRILPEAVERFMPGMSYWPSSPLVELTDDKSQHTTGASPSGDVHYWGVWHNREPFENYNKNVGRFMSEYGFQSFPEYEAVLRYAEEKDMELESDVMQTHQKNGHGNLLIKDYMEQYLHEPKDFHSFLYLSQVLQADAMAMGIEAHRRGKPYCMGTLYWQLNDCWPVASWASVDYYGNWKAVQYHAKRSFREVMASVEENEGIVTVKIVSDLTEPFSGKLHVRLLDFHGVVQKEASAEVGLQPNEAKAVLSLNRAEWLNGLGADKVFLLLELANEEQEPVDAKLHYFVHSKELKLASEPNIRVVSSVTEDGKGTRLTLETDVLARQIWLSAEADGIFSDNFFDLVPGVPVTVDFLARTEGTTSYVPAEAGQVTVRSMADFILLT
ncbi:glycoside hydrolase family 2 protein [Gorillibacterium timonense]|uniref:glycoside hydrolase family 2 protein n=1 Tax=Gorillibacterium timonense TaxID=1689269 RepID=UPI00071CEFF9|nr:glycoside hydrolase family 2 protein [Gorillibacterium timonense]